jgi:MoaA/NifB/PqqE/SkfB family radical SAM enzyme
MTEIIEWKPQNYFNSFSNNKGLCYHSQFKQIMDWMNGKTSYLPPPQECNLDAYAECNLRCQFCAGQRYLRNHRQEVGEMRKLPTEYCLRLVDFLDKWGKVSICLSGGGEPSLHEGMPLIINRAKDRGIESSFVTNMVKISDELANSLMNCRWVAMSVDSADRETYKIVKGADKFDDVTYNIQRLCWLRDRTKSKVDLAFKMLVLEENYTTIFKACKLAKELGVGTFHIRPCDYERDDIIGHKKQKFDMDLITEQFMQCHEIENDRFKVFTVIYKFNSEFHNKQDFKRCLATPLLIPILTDGNAFLCVDKKLQAKYKIGQAFPNPEEVLNWWGSDRHRELIKSVVPIRDCADSRCTFQTYHKIIENAVNVDNFYLKFP